MTAFMRTASAGGVLEMDSTRILLDGVSQDVDPYLPTPPDLIDRLCNMHLDLIAFTHGHADHFDPGFVRRCTGRQQAPRIIGPKDTAAALPELSVITASSQAGPVQVIALPTRHIGAAYRNTPHYSFLLKGSSVVWFLGDASPIQWQGQTRLPHPDLLIAPFAYAATEAAWQIIELFDPHDIILLHLPDRRHDPDQLWPAVDAVLAQHTERSVYIPHIGETWTEK